MKVEKIDLVGIDVKNIDEAERFFSDLLGITFERVPFDELKYSRTLTENADKAYEGQIKAAISPIGLELIESVPPLEKEGLRNINIKVSDFEQAKAEMKSKGIRMLSDITLGNFKEAIYSPEDLHGIRLCVVAYEGSFCLDAMK